MALGGRACYRVVSLLALLLTGLLGRAQDQGVWSDSFVNEAEGDFDYECPDSDAIVGLASDFRTAQSDRQWQYQCGAGRDDLASVSTTCTLQPAIDAVADDIDFVCPDNGYLGGFQSMFVSAIFDRRWAPYCCQRPFAALVDCIQRSSGWENDFRNLLNFSAPNGHVVAGVTSFFFNRDRRWRFQTCAIEVNCTDPGTPANSQRQGDSFLYNDSVTYTCNHGYYQSDGPVDGIRTCLQTGLWSGTEPVCTECTVIENCADIRCTNASDHQCRECESNRGTALGEAGYENLGTQCQPLCSWLQGFCYPGSCPDGLASCNCSAGFSGPDCLNIIVPSELESCSVTIRSSDGQELQINCLNSSSLDYPLYTNLLPHELEADWSAVFLGPSPLPFMPAYVVGVAVGVASSDVHTSLFRAANPLLPVSMVTVPCADSAPSPDSPRMGLSECMSLADSAHLANHTFLHGDTFVTEATVVNGGYLDIRNLDTFTTARHYYTGTPIVGAAKFILDVNPPVHCSLTPSSPCLVGQNLLLTRERITDSTLVEVSWGGWLDDPAGVVVYAVDVYRMSESGEVLSEVLPSVASGEFNHTEEREYQYSVNVTEGAFSVVLRTRDLARNVRYSRRLLLVDITSQLLVDNATAPLVVVSAVPDTGFLWLNSTTTPIVVSGRGHFYNTHLRTQNLLAPVANFSSPIATEYDHPLDSGEYPRGGTPNALGVTELRYYVAIDQEGGREEGSLAEPTAFSLSSDDLALDAILVDSAELQDGDSVRVWFQAVDYLSQVAVDSILFHVDSSAPELDNLWLEWNGITELALHGTETLLDLNIEFQTSDPHSGISAIEYWIGTNPGYSDVAWRLIPVQAVASENCSAPACVCDSLYHCSFVQYSVSPLASDFITSHDALHDTEYYITVSVTNHALLTSSLTHTFTTDTTPPLTGVVMDAELGSHDLDYVQNSMLSAWWADFFDRETSILLFQYHFGTECANASAFSYPLPGGGEVGETADTSATWTAPDTGAYYVTVVAYNHALQPSLPACSDGVIVDQSAPVIDEIVIPGAVETADMTYITTDHNLNVSWAASDNSGIREYHVAAVSEDAYRQGQSANFTSTGGRPYLSLLDPELLSAGNTFYIIIKATDLAQHETEAIVGPITIDISPPVVHGNLTVERTGDHVTVTWQNDSFTDNQSGVVTVEYSIGTSEYGSQVVGFSPLPSLPSPFCPSSPCLPIPTSPLSLLTGHAYFVTLRVRNAAGLESYISSGAFTHIFWPPTEGRVIDLDPHRSFSLEDSCISLHDSDTDLVLDSDWLAARWEGFDHVHLNVTFSVGLGSVPGIDDVFPFHSVGTETRYTFTNASLEHEHRYYVTVIAENEYGTSTATSDGVFLLFGLEAAVLQATVADGSEEGVDIDYQYSTSTMVAQWGVPLSLLPFVSFYQWAVFLQDPMSLQLTAVRPYENVGMKTSATAAGLELRQGEVYISSVQTCLATPIPTCLSPVYSDGVHILNHPEATSLIATYTPLEWNADFATSSYGRLVIEWSPFQDIRMVYYEWALGTAEPGYELITEWSQVEWYETSVTVYINSTVSLHKPNTVALQGYNAAGLYSRIGTELYWNTDGQVTPQDQIPRSKLVVYDIPDSLVPELSSTDWRQLEYSEWDPIDMELDYTSSAHSLSAAWPDLRYTIYNYSVSATPTFTSCDSPSNVAYGTTIANSVTIPDLDLQNGLRYYVCVRGELDNAIHQSPSTPHTFTACTNGITVDLTPPTGSCVEIRPRTLDSDLELGSGGVASGSGLNVQVPFNNECIDNGSPFQTSSSDLHIIWSPFQDVEWYGDALHVTGVAYYEYAIGTQPGDSDVVTFTEVGVVNYIIITGLHLQSGHTYYATVRAHDFTGQWSDVTSPGVTVDLTPPTGPSHFHLVNSDSTYSAIPLVVDTESGVGGMELGLGSYPGSSDLLEWTTTSYRDGIETYIELAGINDGELVFASLQVWNGARLSAIYSSLGHTHDSTPPSPGIVHDTLSHDSSSDADHTPSLFEISASWAGFSDPHSHIVQYHWAIGTCDSCYDVQDFLSVGVATDATRSGLQLSPGVTYYVTVRCCNVIGLCSQASSNGITVDVTPPIAGLISHSYSGGDQQYQSSRSYLAMHWSGFHDAESSLHSYTVSAGMWPGDDSLLPPTSLPPSTTSLLHPFTPPLLTNITVYINLVAINNAGLSTSVTSSGVFIDDTPPSITNIALDTEWAGSVDMATQYTKTAVRVTWDTDDSLSPVNANSWSILSYPGTSIPLDVQTADSRDSSTASGLALSDGSTYSLLVVSCNAAGLCSQGEASAILVDSSPPVDGYFAVETESTFPHNVSVPGGMTWRNRQRGDSRVYLAFYGFSDAHSEVSEYWAEVGSGFGKSDLTEGALLLNPSLASDAGTRIGLVRMVRRLEINETIYITLWAINDVGLESRRVLGSFVVEEVEGRTDNGSLRLLRSSRCTLDSCFGHCTCAARGDLCPLEADSFSGCVEVDTAALPTEDLINVFNESPQQTVTTGDGSLFTALTDKLVGRWEVPDPSPYQRLEWTVGEQGAMPGVGLFDMVVDQIWREAGSSFGAIFSVNPMHPLMDGTSYVFHVRAWLNSTHYSVFQSSGITVDVSGPQVVAGGRIREGGLGEETDMDFSANQTHVEVSWNGVFLSELSGAHSSYQIGIGDAPGSDNVVTFSPVASFQTSAVLSALFSHNRRYYSTLRASSPLGVVVDSISDGFTVDLSPPSVGVVLDGLGYWDAIAQSHTHSLSARWAGFHDAESGIHHYEMAFSETLTPPAESDYMDMGIGLRGTIMDLTLNHGRTYHSHIVAVNNAGVRSLSVASNGITVDTSRPEQLQCSWVELNISSFEPINTGFSPCNVTADEVNGVNLLPPSTEFSPLSGCVSQLLIGAISLPISTSPGSLYTLSIWLAPVPGESGCGHQTPLLARVTAPGLNEVVAIHTQTGDALHRWSRFQFWFTADGPSSILTLSTLSDQYGIVFDGYALSQCHTQDSIPISDVITNRSSVFQVSQEHVSGMRTRVRAGWDVGEAGGMVREYLWAIGTTARGEQLQAFTSTGATPYGVSTELSTFHTQRLYITVLAWNHAGMESLVYGGPYVVDFTPPELAEGGGVWDGMGGDLDYQSSTMLQVDWSDVVDPESGVEECTYSIGTGPGLADLHPHTPTTGTSAQVTLPLLSHGTTVVTTVTCNNGAGLQSTFSSDGVTILLTPPTNYSAYMAISSPFLSAYRSRDGYVASDNVTLRWGGFTEAAGTPLSHEVCLGEGLSVLCVSVGSDRELTIDGVGMASSADEGAGLAVSVTAMNLAGLRSESLRGRVVFQTQPPRDTGSPINTTWIDGSLHFDWTGKFEATPPSPLTFELSLGTLTGSGIIRKWVELSTDYTQYTVSDSRLSEERDYFLTLLAISSSGLHTTATHMEAGVPPTST